ncbi:MAG TPA: hypothetical protein VF666_20445 [Pyrinomonadaceae bacterium]|jgi:hypothetical protein
MHRRGKYHRRFRLPHVVVFFTLFQKGSMPEETTGLSDEADDATDFSRIRCPLCLWHPKASSRWYCSDCAYPEYFFNACGTVWNTFNTRGRCPGCGHQWRWTFCLRCGGWSLHEDWYEPEKRG